MKILKRFTAYFAAIMVLSAVFVPSAFAEDIKIVIDGNEVVSDTPPIISNWRTLVPLRAVSEGLQAWVHWEEETETVTVIKDFVVITVQIDNSVMTKNDEEIVMDVMPEMYNDRTMVPIRAISEAFGCGVAWVEETQTVVITTTPAAEELLPAVSKNAAVMQDTYVGDEYRKPEDGAQNYNDLYVFGTMVMHPEPLTQDSAKEYANAVNTVADALPDVNVYSLLVPTSDEFYAPKAYYQNQLGGFKTVCENLNDNVTAVNVVKPLWEHAGEKIYFDTDHHWTQRGSYYAYSAFKEAKGEIADPLDSFATDRSEGYIGSFGQKLEGTPAYDIVSANPDYVEKFYPQTEAVGTVYNDQAMQEVVYENVPVVKSDYNSYSAFIAGDNALTVFKTSSNSGKKLVILKESYGNAFSTWNVNDYSEVYVIDIRRFNGNGDYNQPMSLSSLYNQIGYDDLVIITYPPMMNSASMRRLLINMQ